MDVMKARNYRPGHSPNHSKCPVPAETPVVSRNGAVRGITTGYWQPCPAKGCLPGEPAAPQISVYWESGDVTFPCQVGWEFRQTPMPHVRITDGGEITGRFVTPRDPKEMPWPKVRQPLAIDWLELDWDPSAEFADHKRPVKTQ